MTDTGKVLPFLTEEAAPKAEPKKKKKKAKKYVDGKYYRTTATYTDPDSGAKKSKYFYDPDSPVLAERKKQEFLTELAKRGAVPDSATTFEMAFNLLIDEKMRIDGRSFNLLDKYKTLKHFLAPLMEQKIKSIKHQSIQDILSGMAEAGKAVATIKEVRSMAKQTFDFAITRRIMDYNPAEKCKIPATAKTKVDRQPATVEQQKLVLAACKGDCKGDDKTHRMRIPALLMVFCGIRRGEMAALLWSDIHIDNADTATVCINKAVYFETNQARSKTPKTAAGTRTIPIPALIVPVLQAAKAAADDDALVMLSKGGSQITKSSFKASWNSYLRYCLGFPGDDERFTAHMLRHSYASNIYAAGCDELCRKKWLGHERDKSNVTEAVYTHLLAQLEAESVAKYNAFCESIFGGDDDQIDPSNGQKG